LSVPDAQGTGGFKDTIATEWYAKYLLKAKELKIVAGYPDGTFKPTQTVNLVENLKMLINTKGVDLTDINVTENPYTDAYKDQWYAKFVQYAKIQKWITPDSKNMIYPSQGMTRGKLSEVLYNSLKGTTTNTPNPTPSPTPTPSPSPVTQPLADLNVSIEGFMFNKKTMTIAQGTKVRWTNKDSMAHTVTSDDGKFDSGSIAPGQTFEFTFNDLGTFNYHCTPHPTMTGSITVKRAIEVPTV
jgi:plastocyanin